MPVAKKRNKNLRMFKQTTKDTSRSMQENNEQSLNKKNTKKKRRHPEIKIS